MNKNQNEDDLNLIIDVHSLSMKNVERLLAGVVGDIGTAMEEEIQLIIEDHMLNKKYDNIDPKFKDRLSTSGHISLTIKALASLVVVNAVLAENNYGIPEKAFYKIFNKLLKESQAEGMHYEQER